MAQDTLLDAEQIISLGKISTDRGNITSDGVSGSLTTAGLITTSLNSSQQFGGVTGGTGGTAITTNGTVSTATRIAKLLPGSAVTGIILGSGVADGQELTILNVAAAASSITFTTAGSAAASSHVSTAIVMSGQRAAKFVWDVGTALWYDVAY